MSDCLHIQRGSRVRYRIAKCVLTIAVAISSSSCSCEHSRSLESNVLIRHLEFAKEGSLSGLVEVQGKSAFFVSVNLDLLSCESRELVPYRSSTHDSCRLIPGSTIRKLIWSVNRTEAGPAEYFCYTPHDDSPLSLTPFVNSENCAQMIVSVFPERSEILVSGFLCDEGNVNTYGLWDLGELRLRAAVTLTEEDFLWPSAVSQIFGPSSNYFVIAQRVVPEPPSNSAAYTRLDLFSVEPFGRLDTASVDGSFYYLGMGASENEVRLVTNTPELVSARVAFAAPSSSPYLDLTPVYEQSMPWAYMRDFKGGGIWQW